MSSAGSDSVSTSALRGRSVLVVEDETLVAMLVEDTLVDAGATVVGPAATVAQALDLLSRESPQMAVLDMNLAGETSESVADALVARGVPFVVASGYGAAGVPERFASAPVLSKPYAPEDLTAALAALAG